MRALSGGLTWAGELGKALGGWLELRDGELGERVRHRRCFFFLFLISLFILAVLGLHCSVQIL